MVQQVQDHQWIEQPRCLGCMMSSWPGRGVHTASKPRAALGKSKPKTWLPCSMGGDQQRAAKATVVPPVTMPPRIAYSSHPGLWSPNCSACRLP